MVLESGWVLVCSVYSAIIDFLYSDSIIYWKADVDELLRADKMGVDDTVQNSKQNGSRRNGNKSVHLHLTLQRALTISLSRDKKFKFWKQTMTDRSSDTAGCQGLLI